MSTLAVSALLVLAAPTSLAQLTFEDRLRAQEAIERVYYGHQIGATRPFAQAVPRAVLETKVRKYLKQTVALEEYWHTPVTAEMLDREMQRMASDTRMPERLRQLFAALGGDAFLVQECLVRPVLVDRLARHFFASDERIHAAMRREAEALRTGLAAGSIDPAGEHPRRTLLEVVRGERGTRDSGEAGRAEHVELAPEEWDRWRERLPERVGQPGPVVESAGRFVVRVLIGAEHGKLRVASFEVPKRTWDSWWGEVAEGLDEAGARTVASPEARLPSAARRGVSCLPDDTWDNGSLDDVPDPRSDATGVWTGREMIVWGGATALATNHGGRYDPATDSWTLTSIAGAPQKRTRHTAVWTGTEMIVWGGSYLDSGGRYDPQTDGWTPTSTVGAPEARTRHTAVWTGTEMIVWGGEPAGPLAYLATGGRYDPATDTWAPTSALNAPQKRRLHTAVWTGTEMIVWGGYGGSYQNTGGRYDPATDTWTPTSTVQAPSERNGHTAVWTGGRMVIWGGGKSSYGPVATGGLYDPATDKWAPTSTAGAPSARWGPRAVWTGSSMIVWGGVEDDNDWPTYFDTGARYDPATDHWAPTSTANAPAGRIGHAAVWTGDAMVVWGGSIGDAAHPLILRYLNTGGRYDPATDSWTPTAMSSGLSARGGHTTVWTGNLAVVWGGDDFLGYGYYGSGPFADTGGRYDPALDAWTPTALVNAPSARVLHTAVWTGDLMLVWGGDDQSPWPSLANTGGRYDPITDTWTPVATFHAPDGRLDHTAVWTGTEMLVWGGRNYTPCGAGCGSPTALHDGGRYDPSTDAWLHSPSVVNVPEARHGHTAVWTGSRMIVWGGLVGGAPPSYETVDSGGAYDPTSDAWTPTSTAGAPSPRQEHSALWTGQAMVVWGGREGCCGDLLATGGRYDPAADAWTPTSAVDAPAARARHTAVWTGSEMVVWAGADSDEGTGGRYDPQADAWKPTSTVDAPSGRAGHSAVWTGSEMVVWGGYGSYALLDTGGRYVVGTVTDGDGDGASECGGDCDDGDPAVFPGAIEACDGLDNDCSGTADDVDADGDGYSACSVDCDDADAGAHAVPLEVTGQAFSDTVTLSWDSAAPGGGSATVHDVVAGLLSELPVGSGAAETCLAAGIAESVTTDESVPEAGSGHWYLVRGRNGCGAGTYGSESDGDPRLSPTCP